MQSVNWLQSRMGKAGPGLQASGQIGAVLPRVAGGAGMRGAGPSQGCSARLPSTGSKSSSQWQKPRAAACIIVAPALEKSVTFTSTHTLQHTPYPTAFKRYTRTFSYWKHLKTVITKSDSEIWQLGDNKLMWGSICDQSSSSSSLRWFNFLQELEGTKFV